VASVASSLSFVAASSPSHPALPSSSLGGRRNNKPTNQPSTGAGKAWRWRLDDDGIDGRRLVVGRTATARASDDERHMGSEAGRGLMMDGDNQQPTNL
jgi:hypothetical protein